MLKNKNRNNYFLRYLIYSVLICICILDTNILKDVLNNINISRNIFVKCINTSSSEPFMKSEANHIYASSLNNYGKEIQRKQKKRHFICTCRDLRNGIKNYFSISALYVFIFWNQKREFCHKRKYYFSSFILITALGFLSSMLLYFLVSPTIFQDLYNSPLNLTIYEHIYENATNNIMNGVSVNGTNGGTKGPLALSLAFSVFSLAFPLYVLVTLIHNCFATTCFKTSCGERQYHFVYSLTAFISNICILALAISVLPFFIMPGCTFSQFASCDVFQNILQIKAVSAFVSAGILFLVHCWFYILSCCGCSKRFFLRHNFLSMFFYGIINVLLFFGNIAHVALISYLLLYTRPCSTSPKDSYVNFLLALGSFVLLFFTGLMRTPVTELLHVKKLHEQRRHEGEIVNLIYVNNKRIKEEEKDQRRGKQMQVKI